MHDTQLALHAPAFLRPPAPGTAPTRLQNAFYTNSGHSHCTLKKVWALVLMTTRASNHASPKRLPRNCSGP
eukprot:7567720-Alexandrium_andersonii.AAC.1